MRKTEDEIRDIVLELIETLNTDPAITDTIWMTRELSWTAVEALCAAATQLGATEEDIARCTHT